MSKDLLPTKETDLLPARQPADSVAWKVLLKLSSLRITVVLFSLSIFLVLVGTLAQATEGLWAVISQYFRSFVVFIPLQAFFPPAWFPEPDFPQLNKFLNETPYGILFPGGKTLGVMLMINLIAAHVVRFKANGSRTAIQWGTIFIGVGLALTALIVLGASYKDGIQDEPMVSYTTIWRTMLSAIIAIGAAMSGMIFFLEKKQNLERILLIIGVALAAIAATGLYVLGAMYEQMESAMRIVWQLTQATVVGAVLLTGCAMIFRNRGGIVLLHFGISLMMINELFVGMYAVEERITVAEKQSTSYAYNPQDVELAITYRGDDQDTVVSIPIQELVRGNVISHEQLPFNIRVEAYFPNSQLVAKKTPGSVDSIDIFQRGYFSTTQETLKLQPVCGRGLFTKAVQIKRWAGAAAQQRIDMATAYVSILDAEIENAEVPENEDKDFLGNVLMLSQHYSERSTRGRDDGANSEKIKVADRVYEVALRFRRTLKPYSVFLVDVREASHHGSTRHKKFESDFLITDRNTGEVQNGSITMNNPLRFRGETFYQSGYSQMNTSRGPVEVSTFQVVTNQSWMIPYIGCMYVVIGMLAQFGSGMLKFSERVQKRKSKALGPPPATDKQIQPFGTSTSSYPMNTELTGSDLGSTRSMICWILPLIVGLLGLYTMYTLTYGKKAKTDEFDIRAAGGIPISSGGRFQPMDTFARVKLRNASDYESVSLTKEQVQRKLKGDRKRIYATEWLLDVMTKPEVADEEYRIFRIYDPFLINKLGIQKKRKGYTYTYNEVTQNINEFNIYVQEAVEKRQRDGKSDGLSFQQRKAMTLSGKIRAYENLRNTTTFLGNTSEEAVGKLLNGRLLYHPIMPDVTAEDIGKPLDSAIVERILAEENVKSATFMNNIFRLVRNSGSLVAGQADNPLFVPTADKVDIEVQNKTERLALVLGNNPSDNEVSRGSIVMQADDRTVWKLIDDRRASPDEPSKDTDWEIQPGMETLLVSAAKLALQEFCEDFKISTFEEFTSKLKEMDDDYLIIPDDAVEQERFLTDFGRKQKKIADEYLEKFKPAIEAVYQKSAGRGPTPEELVDIKDKISRTLIFLAAENLKTIRQEYEQYASIFYEFDMKQKSSGTDEFQKVLAAYKSGEAELFNEQVKKYKTFFDSLKLADYENRLVTVKLWVYEFTIDKVKLELFYQYSSPLFQALIFYGVAALFVVLTWVFYGVSLDNIGLALQRTSLVVLALGSLIHTIGIIERVVITGKAPVTNLYGSAVFISWGSVMCGFIIDFIVRYASPKASKLGIGAFLGAIVGFVVIMVSFNLALRSDTFGKVEAVLDTQFWLATHVVCVTFGYVATFVAGALSLVYLAGSAFSPVFDKEVRRGVSWIIYGIVCFALLLSFFGTVLGGLWADDSWGRFWGWDPKENGALLIVIWNALILHARWGGMIRERGLAILAVGGNVVTCWSWFGVNELGVGLHSYGFTEGLLVTLCGLAIGHLAVIIVAGSIPTRLWRGYREDLVAAEASAAPTDAGSGQTPGSQIRSTKAPKRSKKRNK